MLKYEWFYMVLFSILATIRFMLAMHGFIKRLEPLTFLVEMFLQLIGFTSMTHSCYASPNFFSHIHDTVDITMCVSHRWNFGCFTPQLTRAHATSRCIVFDFMGKFCLLSFCLGKKITIWTLTIWSWTSSTSTNLS